MKIRYIGKKPSRSDTLYGSGLVWEGPGDVQSCNDHGKAKALLRHTDMFEPADSEAASLAPPAARPTTPAEPLVPELLIGTDAFGSMINFGGDRVASLGDVVAAAHRDSGLSVVEWNSLSQEERDERIGAKVDQVRKYIAAITAAPAPASEPENKDGQGDAEGSAEQAAEQAGTAIYQMLTEEGPLDLSALDKEALRRIAKEKSLNVSNNAGENTLRKRLAEAFPVA